MSEEGYGPGDVAANYDFGASAPPEGYDPDAKRQRRPDAGEHTMEIKTFTMHPKHTFNWQKVSYVLTQLRPVLVVTSKGKNEGAECIDFLPMPTPGCEMGLLANRWANFLKAFGFKVTEDSLVPVGFDLNDLIGKKANVTIQEETDSDGDPKKWKGVIQTQVAFFGYELPSGTPAGATKKEETKEPEKQFKL